MIGKALRGLPPVGVTALYYNGNHYFIKIQRAKALQMKNIKYFTNENFLMFFHLWRIRKNVVSLIGLSNSHLRIIMFRFD